VHAALALHGAERLAETFDADGVRLRIRLPADRVEALAAHLRDATRNRARIGDNPSR
jgi:putative IMPACT (imprinted ancient) family translation regulator